MRRTVTAMQRRAQLGFSLVSAIFLLVVIAALGTFAVTLSTTQHQSAALDVMGARAYQASRAGVDWAAFQIVQSSVAAPPAGAGGFADICQAGTTSSSVTLAGTLTAFNPVSVSCTSFPAVENTTTVRVYRIVSSAVTAAAVIGSPDYVERVISVTIAQ